MKRLYIKQKVFSLSGKFTVRDEAERDVYFVEGSFMQIPKTFSVYDEKNEQIAVITKKTFSFLPTFYLEVDGREMVTIKKEFSFFKARYQIDAEDVTVEGNVWDMNFQVLRRSEVIGSVSKQWFSWGDSYQVEILEEDLEHLIIGIVIAIDCVKADQAAASSAAT